MRFSIYELRATFQPQDTISQCGFCRTAAGLNHFATKSTKFVRTIRMKSFLLWHFLILRRAGLNGWCSKVDLRTKNCHKIIHLPTNFLEKTTTFFDFELLFLTPYKRLAKDLLLNDEKYQQNNPEHSRKCFLNCRSKYFLKDFQKFNYLFK